MVEDLHSVVSDEELYLKIEETILAIPEVKGFTSEGLQHIVKGITSAFGKKVHKGILIRHDKNGMTINILSRSFMAVMSMRWDILYKNKYNAKFYY